MVHLNTKNDKSPLKSGLEKVVTSFPGIANYLKLLLGVLFPVIYPDQEHFLHSDYMILIRMSEILIIFQNCF